MAIEHRTGRGAEVALRIRRIRLALTGNEAGHLALVFLCEAHLVVLGVALEEHEAEAVGAHREIDPRLLALAQHPHAGRLDIRARHLVDVRVRRIEAGVQVGEQRMAGDVAMLVYAPALAGETTPARDAMEMFHVRMRRQA